MDPPVSLPSRRRVTPASPHCKAHLPVSLLLFQVISQKTLKEEKTKKISVFFSLLAFSAHWIWGVNVKIQTRQLCPIGNQLRGNFYWKTTKSFIINSVKLIRFRDLLLPTAMCTTSGTFVHRMLAFVSVTSYPFLWMCQSTGKKTLLFPSPSCKQT